MLAGQGLNLQPPDPKSGVLPVELPATADLNFTCIWLCLEAGCHTCRRCFVAAPLPLLLLAVARKSRALLPRSGPAGIFDEFCKYHAKVDFLMGSLIKKRRKRMRKKKYRKMRRRTRFQRRRGR